MDYTKLSRSELVELCKQRSIKGYSTKKKQEIIEMLKTADNTIQDCPTGDASTQKIVDASPTIVHEDNTPVRISIPQDIMSGASITKEKRHELFGQVAGGAGALSPEKYQRAKIVEGTGRPCLKTNTRINLRTNDMRELACPNKLPDGFDYSEDFDGLQTIGGKSIYINLKCVVGAGGTQTRSLREVYWFVEGQLKIVGTNEVYFANILDGDEANSVMTKFEYLRGLPEYARVKNKVYVGDLRGYFEWLVSNVVPPVNDTL